jgi:23S rRNA (adenine2503-C2)-methyltransferase
MPSLAAHDRASLEDWMAAHQAPRSQAGRVLRAYYTSCGAGCGALDWDALELGAPLRAALRAEFAEPATTELRRAVSADGTTKLLLGLRRGGAIEAVMMPSYRAGEAWCCVSSQVGCAMGCDFCASTRAGLERNLETDEIVEQYLAVGAVAASQGRRVRRLVFMGMGEPLHNLDAVLGAVDRIASPGLGNLGWRRITVSTVGIVHGIERLAKLEHPPFLALSLHAPDDETRAKIVPTSKRYDVATILAAARDFQATTGRIVTLEYCLLAGVNDRDAQAELLAERLMDPREGFRAHVNVIPYNPIGASGAGLSGVVYMRPSAGRVARFLAILRERGVVAHARDPRGDDVAAACGQLREHAGGPR